MTESQALEEIRVALSNLGADTNCVPEILDESVHDELVRRWREEKSPPLVIDVAEAIGVLVNSVNRSLKRLESAGRVRKPSKGIWIPL